MVIDMKKDKLVIMDWGGVVESHSEESYLAHNVVKYVLDGPRQNRQLGWAILIFSGRL